MAKNIKYSEIKAFNEIRQKYQNVSFENFTNQENHKKLFNSLEIIEYLEHIISDQRKKTFEEKIFILLNWQILANNQQQLSKHFTSDKPAIKAISFAKNNKGMEVSWFRNDRNMISHVLNYPELKVINFT